MTATPIPRTLALARYGDLDVSVLRELPRGRRAIQTRIVAGERARARAYEELREQCAAGRQAFVVCPLVEEADPADLLAATVGAGPEASAGAEVGAGTGGEVEVRAATAEYERLAKGELEGFELELLHGGMRPAEKQQAMARFASGKADVLVATTVIEVGVDVPEATVMVVESADRFGMAQLHQLRGRVGRGTQASWCFLLGAGGEDGLAAERLAAVERTSDGFALAEEDLRLRGEGTLLGARQQGQSDLRMASLTDPEDRLLLVEARRVAEAIVGEDPQLVAHEELADEVRLFLSEDEGEYLFKS
jgi:ATP-dependent DNA helicase RecG